MKTGNKPNIMLGRKTGKEKSSLDNFKAAKHYIVTGRDKSKSKAFETMENYRQSTAKALGILEYTEHNKNWFLYPDNPMSQEGKWQPDKDANHTLMVLDWLREQKVGSLQLLKIFDRYCMGADMKAATEKAWEEYITSQEDK